MDSVGSSVMNRHLGIGRKGGIGGRSAQQVQRHFDRLIVRLIGRHIGLRATIFLWPLAAVAVLYVIYRVFGVHPELLIYIAVFVAIIAVVMIWWWHVANNKS